MIELTREQVEAAKARGEARRRGPRAESAHYDAGCGWVIVRLTTGVVIGFAPRDAQGLRHATRDDLALIEVDALGLGIHFPRLDTDFYVPALREGMLGSKGWLAAQSDARQGRSKGNRKPTARLNVGDTGRCRKAGRPA